MNVRAGGFAAPAQAQNLRQSFRVAYLLLKIRANGRRICRHRRGCHSGISRAWLLQAHTVRVSARFFPQNGVDQILHCIGFGNHAIGQTHAASVSQAQHQFHAL